MAHNLLGQRFYNRSSKPAWHRLGLNAGDTDYRTAREAVEAIGGIYHVEKREITFPLSGVATPTEFESYRRSRGGEDKSTESLIAGERARRIRTAFALCEVVDRYETVNASVVARKVFA